jgi:ATP-dependent protease HslVU (ClpYQ) peptidase subunit
MTCIVGVVYGKNVWLGGDRAATSGNLNRTIIKDPKVFVKENIGFGVCGLPKVMDTLQYHIEIPVYNGENVKTYLVSSVIPAIRSGLKAMDCTVHHEGQDYFEGAMLVAFNGRLFELEANFQLVESSKGFNAVGSGAEPALGSLRATKGNPRTRLLQALQTSAENNAGVAPPFDVIEIKRQK